MVGFRCGFSLHFLRNFQYRRYLVQERNESRGCTWSVPVRVKDWHAFHPGKGASYAFATIAHLPCCHPFHASDRIRGIWKTGASFSKAPSFGYSDRGRGSPYPASECHGRAAGPQCEGKAPSSGANPFEGNDPSPVERCTGTFRPARPWKPRCPPSSSDFSPRGSKA